MRRLSVLLLAAGLLLGSWSNAHAVDVSAKGEWNVSFDYGQNGKFTSGETTGWGRGGEDEFEAKQRFRTQIDAASSEALSGTLFFEIGSSLWGKATSDGRNYSRGGAALGADSTSVIKLRRAYIDWMVPYTDLQVRMGIQGMEFPSYTTGGMVFNDDVAGIATTYTFTDNVGISVLWARPYNDNNDGGYYANTYKAQGYQDNFDVFALLIPLSFDGVKVTPWGAYATIGPYWDNNSCWIARNPEKEPTSYRYTAAGISPVGGPRHKDGTSKYARDVDMRNSLHANGDAFWAGLTGEVTLFDPFRIAWDFNYGSIQWHDDGSRNRSGWLASLLMEYKTDFVTPGIYGWYGSGDDSNPANGSERMPYISVANTNNGFSDFAANGAPWDHSREGLLTANWNGTWGVGLRFKNISFVEDLKHTLYVNYIGGTNSPAMAKKVFLQNGYASNDATIEGKDPLYLTTLDSALEFGLRNQYQIYENLQLYVEGAYIMTMLSKNKKVWGRTNMNGKGEDTVNDPWNVNMTLVYSF
ncbi:MAG: outer membrane homotrimeric porin [Desulfovibrio sp.]|jgi:hypothetical protein|nr:outer membrane homotrimeric porin [Desulfovibrio sp.]